MTLSTAPEGLLLLIRALIMVQLLLWGGWFIMILEHSHRPQFWVPAAVQLQASVLYTLLVFSGVLDKVPLVWVIAAGVVLSGACCWAGGWSYGAIRREPDLTAIQESLDTLPAGLGFYTEDGHTLFINREMEDLYRELYGDGVPDLRRFFREGLEGSPTETVLRTADGSVKTLKRKRVVVNRRPAVELSAIDTTELDRLERQLHSENDRLREINARLRRHSDNVDALTREEEILRTKVGIHDTMGETLLASRYWLHGGAKAGDARKLIGHWKECVLVLKREADVRPEEDPFRQVREAARAVGLTLDIEGTLPRGEAVMRIVFHASRECILNCVQHAGATRLLLAASPDGDGWRLRFTNNGNPPAGPIREGGGLTELRRTVTRAGGSMRVEASPEFSLSIWIPEYGG